eukprot:TRINITY_DN7329_c0_g1_i2.p2 TRINITY_DN7329_c0_g1~~TRINITY_DN7329_c0_g1_i2.p2  ORF type:complete len:149 (+),score=55.89 TRINITY_DN7329_c0_g1_i2:96-542(+)
MQACAALAVVVAWFAAAEARLSDVDVASFAAILTDVVPAMRADLEQYRVQLPPSDFRRVGGVRDAEVVAVVTQWVRDFEAEELAKGQRVFSTRKAKAWLKDKFYAEFHERQETSDSELAALYLLRQWLRKSAPDERLEQFFLSRDSEM